jgi:hypothetical protein
MVSIRKLGTVLHWYTVPGRWPLYVNLIQYYLGIQFQEDGQYYLGTQFQEDGLHT